MPSSPASLCLDCSSRAVNGTKYCEAHATKNRATEHRRLFDIYRKDDFVRSLYRTKRWTRGTRPIVLRRDILCKMCGHRTATEADHIVSARLVVEQFGVDEFYNPDRCQGLCHDCHSSKTSTECGFARKRSSQTEHDGRAPQTAEGRDITVEKDSQPPNTISDQPNKQQSLGDEDTDTKASIAHTQRQLQP